MMKVMIKHLRSSGRPSPVRISRNLMDERLDGIEQLE